MIDQSPIAALAGDPATASGFIGKSVRLSHFCLTVPDYTTIRKTKQRYREGVFIGGGGALTCSSPVASGRRATRKLLIPTAIYFYRHEACGIMGNPEVMNMALHISHASSNPTARCAKSSLTYYQGVAYWRRICQTHGTSASVNRVHMGKGVKNVRKKSNTNHVTTDIAGLQHGVRGRAA